MTISLYYIEGISRIDTPYFATKTTQASLSKQEEFFSNHLVQSVETSYYPPHYRNTIKFDTEDIDFNTSVNYLSLEYNSKTYYYFIDSINYVSETIIELDITMDVIQTYMFDIYISNGIIERKFKNRWNLTHIDRDYIRENVSENEFYYVNHTILNENPYDWLVFVPRTKYFDHKHFAMNVEYDKRLPGFTGETPFISSYGTYILPFYYSLYSGETYWETDGTEGGISPSDTVTNARCDLLTGFGYYNTSNVTVDMFICPFNCAKDLTLSYSFLTQNNSISFNNGDFIVMNHYYTSHSVQIHCFALCPSRDYNDLSYLADTCTFRCKVKEDTYTLLDFAKNTTLNKPFNSKYITQLLDENYIRYTFGSLPASTTIPLYKLKENRFMYHYAFNPTDGTRIYWLTPLDSVEDLDVYNTCILDTNIIHFDLKNDPWVNYISANRSRWVAAGVNTALDIFAYKAASGMKNKFAKQDIEGIVSNPNSYDRRYKTPQLKKKPGAEVKSLERRMATTSQESNISSISSANNNLVGQFFTDMNVQAQPPTAKQISNISGIGVKDAYIMHYVMKVNDYEQCAQYYHRNGFLVNEYINHKDNIFAYVFNRYYFNVLKMSLPNVHLHNVVEDEDTCDAIKDRLIDGVRLWNVNNTGVVIGDFQYDNVELDYLP